jgi:hypothetical protein
MFPINFQTLFNSFGWKKLLLILFMPWFLLFSTCLFFKSLWLILHSWKPILCLSWNLSGKPKSRLWYDKNVYATNRTIQLSSTIELQNRYVLKQFNFWHMMSNHLHNLAQIKWQMALKNSFSQISQKIGHCVLIYLTIFFHFQILYWWLSFK